MYTVQRLQSKENAQKICELFFAPGTFDMTWAPGEKEMVKKAVYDSVMNPHHAYFFVDHEGKILGAIGVSENEYKNGGYNLDQDYFAVKKEFRNQGIGTALFHEMESFVCDQKGRYIVIATCDTAPFEPARRFYIKQGYQEVGRIPDYYAVGEGKIEYWKKLQ